MKLNDTQQDLLDAAASEYGRLLAARVEAKAVGRRAEEAYIADQQLRWDMAAARYALAEGSKAQLRARTTKNPATVDKAIASGMRFVKDEILIEHEPEVDTGARFRMDGDELLVTLQPEDFEPFKAGFPEGLPTEGQQYAFRLDAAGNPIPVDADKDETWLHPVVKVALTPKMKPELLDFIESQGRG